MKFIALVLLSFGLSACSSLQGIEVSEVSEPEAEKIYAFVQDNIGILRGEYLSKDAALSDITRISKWSWLPGESDNRCVYAVNFVYEYSGNQLCLGYSDQKQSAYMAYDSVFWQQ